MSFKFNHVVKGNIPQANTKVIQENNNNVNLSKQDTELLLKTIKNSHFSGDMLETLYTLTHKLQKHYNQIK